jgi:UDP-N-acetylmuramate dehydrogenase
MSIAVIKGLCEHYGAAFLEQTSIAPYTSFKIGGKCNIIDVNKVDVIRTVLKHCTSESIPYRVLGKGSNVLISDRGLDGVVFLIGNDFTGIDTDAQTIKCHAGTKLSDICKAAALHSLAGIEFAYGIPGTVGGALYMNAGAFGGEISDVIESCTYLDENGLIHQISADEMKLSYRNSIFTQTNWVITQVRIRLKYGCRTAIKEKMDEYSSARLEKQPLDFPSAGSTFKRPHGHFAAKLIEDCGLKGKTIGGAQVSEKHAGFIVNTADATFSDVVELIEFVKQEVYKQTKVKLECEVKIWNS